jgi:hypothetical protein
MNAEVVDKLVSALRSGKYTQVRGYLKRQHESDRRRNCHCVAGVLCEVLGVKWERNTKRHADSKFPVTFIAVDEAERWDRHVVPPDWVRKAAGIQQGWHLNTHVNFPKQLLDVMDAKRVTPENDGVTLFDLNDLGLTFPEIADFLEQNAEEL